LSFLKRLSEIPTVEELILEDQKNVEYTPSQDQIAAPEENIPDMGFPEEMSGNKKNDKFSFENTLYSMGDWLSTHPASEERIKNLEKIKQSFSNSNLEIPAGRIWHELRDVCRH